MSEYRVASAAARASAILSPAAMVAASSSRRTPLPISFPKFPAPSGDDANNDDEVR